MIVKKGEIYYIKPYERMGSEQRAGRPAVIVSNNMNNQKSSVVEIVF